MGETIDREGSFDPDWVDAVGLVAAALFVVLAVAYGVLIQRILFGVLVAPVVVAFVVGLLALRRVAPELSGSVEPDRYDAAGIGVTAVFGVLILALGVLAQAILVALLFVAFLGTVTAAALVVRRVV